MKKNIYIIMEITKRELYGNLLLTLYALKNNFNVYIGDTNTYKYLIKRKLIDASIIHTKSIVHGKLKSELHESLQKKNFLITAIDEEHGVLDNLDYIKFFASNRLSNKELEKIAAFFCWGKYDYIKLRNFFPNYKKKFHLTGSPRADIWKKKSIFKKKIDNPIFSKRCILICTNFSFANNITSHKWLFKKKRLEGYYDRSPELYRKNKIFYDYQKKLLFKFVDLINSLTKRYPNYNFCVRPHPTENVDFWRTHLIKNSNLYINNSKSSSYWIQNSDMIIQSGCTTGSEGIISGKNVINYIPVNLKVGFGEYLKEISINARNKSQVFEIIENNKNYKSLNKKFKTKLDKRILFNKNIAAKNISNVWLSLSKGTKNSKNNIFQISLSLFIFENLKLFIQKFILLIKGKNIKFKKLLNYKYPDLERKFIEHEIINLSKHFNLKKKFEVKKLRK